MSEINSKCFLFAGPTLYCANRINALSTNGIHVLPPIKRGDIETAISAATAGVILIVDGNFHQCLSVGHAEIASAMSKGWVVWGLSSIGAIRAYEMRDMGMRGYGRVYNCFFGHYDFRDDEVALIHEPEPPYRAFTEPLVHIRFCLREFVDSGLLTDRQEKQLLDDLMRMWFGDRKLSHFRTMLIDLIPKREKEVDATLGNFDRFRVKCHDLADFLRERPWTAH